MAKNIIKKGLLKAGSTVAMAMAMTSVISMQANATEIDQSLPVDVVNEPVISTESNVTVDNEAVVSEAVNEVIEQANAETITENNETVENNQQVEQENNTAAENNESNSGGELVNPDLELPEAPAAPDTEGMGAEDYNEAVGDYNEAVDGYNEAVDGYNGEVDDYNSAAEDYDQQAQEKYEEDKAAFDEAKAEHEEAEQQYNEDKTQYEENSQAYQDYLKAQAEYEAAKKIYDEELAQYNEDQVQYEEDSQAYQDYLKAQAEYEAAKKIYDEELAQYNEDKTQYEENSQAYQDYLDDLAQYEEDKKVYDEELAEYNEDKTQYEKDSQAYQDYLKAQAEYEEAKKDYDAKQAEYEDALVKYEADSVKYQAYVDAKAAYDTAYEAYQDQLAQYETNYAKYQQDSAEYQAYLDAKAQYEQAKTEYDKVVDAYEAEDAIYDEVTEYNQQVENKNSDIEDKNAALEDDLHADTVDSIEDVGEINQNIEIDEDVLTVLGEKDDLAARQSALLAEATALDAHAGKNAALGSQEYTAYLAAVEAYNEKVTEFNNDVDIYNLAVEEYNKAVEAYNENKDSSTDSSTDSTTDKGTADWGNINIGDRTFSHIDVKYTAATAKDKTVEVDANGNETVTYSDSVTEYTVVGVYSSEEAAKNDPNSYSVTYISNANSSAQIKVLQKQSTEFKGGNGTNLDPEEGQISFYMTLEENGNTHGITVNLDDTDVYPEGTYYAGENSSHLAWYTKKNGEKLPTVKIGNTTYYDISGQSVFVISALTCNGAKYQGGNWNNSTSVSTDGLDLVLNVQTLIEIHQSENAKKISYLGYELGKTAQATAPTDPGEFSETEPTPMDPPTEPVKPTFNEIEPDPVEEPVAPVAPIAPEAPDEVTDPGEGPVAPVAPVAPDEVTDPGEGPVAPIAPVAPDEVTDPGEGPVAPIAPTAPDEVPDPGDAPVGPGTFDQTEPKAPVPANRLNHAERLEKLEEKVVVEIPDPEPEVPAVPMLIDWEDDGEIEIMDEEVPLADAPKTGDMSAIWAAISSLSLGGVAVINRKRKEEE